MAVYAIGDIQGCHDALLHLLEEIGFCDQDRLWFCGDLVNRGPQSLETLRFVRALGERAVTVLGNHDLHLLAVATGLERQRPADTLDAFLAADDREELIHWLRQQPLLHHDDGLGFTLVHAGISPQWNLAQARVHAHEVEAVLGGDDWLDFLRHMYGNEPRLWRADLDGWDRLRYIVNSFTRMRYCYEDGGLDMIEKGPVGSQPAELYPWYRMPGRPHEGLNIVFGHWSTLDDPHLIGLHPLDTGCLWGGSLTALRLDRNDPRRYAVNCPQQQRPRGIKTSQ